MRRTTIMLVLALAACGKSEPEVSLENATPEQVAAEMKKSGIAEELRKPGKWAYETTITQIDAPGMPPEMAAQMKQVMGQGQKLERCVTAEEIAKVDAFVGANQANCTFAKYKVGGGRVEGEARCDQGGMKQHMVMDGKYTPDSSDMTIRSTTSGAPGPAGEMKMTMRIKSNRLGDC